MAGLSSIISGVLGVGGDGGASDLQKKALAEISKVQFPDMNSMKVYLQKLVQQGVLTPQQAQTFTQQKSEYENMDIDPTGRDAQVEALQQLQDLGQNGGMTAIDKAQLNDIENEFATTNRGAQEAISQNMAEKGQSGAGTELAAKLLAEQGAATTGSNQAVNVAANAQARALESLKAGANLGTTIYGEDADLAAKKAEAQDAINRFNTTNSQNVENINVATRNDAAEKNLAEKQRVSDTNVNNTNVAEVANKALPQLDFQNKMAKAGAIAGQYGNLAETKLNQAQRQDAFTGQLIGAGGQILAGYNKKKTAGMWKGGKVGPGHVRRPGDHPANDTVPANLSPGETVIPRSKASDPVKAAAFAAREAGAPHPDDLEAVISALASMRSKYKPKAKAA